MDYKNNCIICEEDKDREKGYFILDSFICLECENDILQTETSSAYYSFILKQMKKLNKIAMPS